MEDARREVFAAMNGVRPPEWPTVIQYMEQAEAARAELARMAPVVEAALAFEDSANEDYMSVVTLCANVVTLCAKVSAYRASTPALPTLTCPHVCRDCGSTKEVTFGPDPFAAEIHNDETPFFMCAICRDASAAEV